MSSSSAKQHEQKLKTPGTGGGESVHPWAVTVEAPQDESLIPEGYGIKYNAYHTLTEGVFLPTGTLLPGGAVFTMSAVLEFPTWIPEGTKMPGGMLTPVSMNKKQNQYEDRYEAPPESVCRVM